MERLQGGNKVAEGPTQERGDVFLRAAGGLVNGGHAEDEVTIAMLRAGPDKFITANEGIR